MDKQAVENAKENLYAQTDPVLGILVKLANTVNLELGLTLNMSGVIVSGFLIGDKKYLDGMTATFEQIKQVSGNQSIDALKAIPAELKAFVERQEKEDKENEALGKDDELVITRHIHLKNVKFYSPDGGAIPNVAFSYWRGKITSIDGFTVGILGKDTQ